MADNVPVDLDKLIERIVIAPKTPKWMQSLIKNVVTTYGLSEDLQSYQQLQM
jgi:hypothetical protein